MEKIISIVLLSMDLHMVVNQHLRLSPSLYKQYCNIVDFKVDFHRIYVKERKDRTRTWHPFPYLVTEDDLLVVVQCWSEEWMTPPSEDIEIAKGTPQDAGPSGKDKDKET